MLVLDDIEYALRLALEKLEEYHPDYNNDKDIQLILDILIANFD